MTYTPSRNNMWAAPAHPCACGISASMHVKVDVEIQGAAEALDQCHGTGLSRRVGQSGFLDEMRGDRSVDDPEHRSDLGRLARQQEPQGERHAQHPLSQGLTRQHLINQQRRALDHPPRAAARAKAPPFVT